MKRELKVTLSSAEVHEQVVKAVARKQKLGEVYTCACSMDNGALSLVFTLPEDAP